MDHGIFHADPAPDFPPGTIGGAALTTTGLLHFICGAIGFYAVIAACFVFARRAARLGRRLFAGFSIVTGIGFFTSFAAVASGSSVPTVLIAFYGAVAWLWLWHSVLLLDLRARLAS